MNETESDRLLSFWIADQTDPQGSALDGTRAMVIRGSVDVRQIRLQLHRLIATEPSLRHRYEERSQRVTAVPVEADKPAFTVEDLATEDEAWATLAAAPSPVDPGQPPLLRCRLLRYPPDGHILVLTASPLAVDIPRWARLWDDLLRSLSGAPLTDNDGAADDAEIAASRVAAPRTVVWPSYRQSLVEDLTPLRLGDGHHHGPRLRRGERTVVELTEPLSDQLRHLAAALGVPVDAVLLAALGVVLRRYTGVARFGVGVHTIGFPAARPAGNRENFVLVPFVIDADTAVDELIARAASSLDDVERYRSVPIESVIAQLVGRVTGGGFPFHVAFTSDRLLLPDVADPHLVDLALGEPGKPYELRHLTVQPAPLPRSVLPCDLLLRCRTNRRRITLSFVADENTTGQGQGALLAEDYREVVSQIVQRDSARLVDLDVAPPRPHSSSSRSSPPVATADGFVQFPASAVEGSIPERFAAIAAAHPHRPALCLPSGDITYAGLMDRAARVATALWRTCGPGNGRVALMLERPEHMVAAILGTLMAGKVYVPLDPSYPPVRLAHALSDAAPELLVHDATPDRRSAPTAVESSRRLHIDEVWHGPADPPRVAITPDTIASILYTSGSTGRPKGVLQNHRNILFHVRNLTNLFGIAPTDRHSVVASFSFDASTTDTYCALLNGAALVPIDVAGGGISRLSRELHTREVTLYHSTPTVFRQLTDGDRWLRSSKLRLVLLGGEPLTAQDVAIGRDRLPATCLLVNGYGATETGGFLALHVVRYDEPSGPVVPIGRALDGIELELHDEDGLEVVLEGELFARSAHLGVGYWRSPEATARTFLHSVKEGAESQLYRTGDLVRRQRDGNLRLIGRRDRQVKVRGQRIELGEVEAALREVPGVAHASVVVRDDPRNNTNLLVAYVVPDGGGTIPADLRSVLAATLPPSMVPSQFVPLDELPITPTGKVDVARLPAPTPVPPRHGDTAESTSQRLVAGLWCELLGLTAVGLDDNFFDLGGHSLLMARVHGRLENHLGRQLELYRLFEHPTIRSCARYLDGDPEVAEVPERLRQVSRRVRQGHAERTRRSRRPLPPRE